MSSFTIYKQEFGNHGKSSILVKTDSCLYISILKRTLSWSFKVYCETLFWDCLEDLQNLVKLKILQKSLNLLVSKDDVLSRARISTRVHSCKASHQIFRYKNHVKSFINCQKFHKLNGGESKDSCKLHAGEYKWTLVALYEILPLLRLS